MKEPLELKFSVGETAHLKEHTFVTMVVAGTKWIEPRNYREECFLIECVWIDPRGEPHRVWYDQRCLYKLR